MAWRRRLSSPSQRRRPPGHDGRQPERRRQDALLPDRHGRLRHVQRGLHRRLRRPPAGPLHHRRGGAAGGAAWSRSRHGPTSRHDALRVGRGTDPLLQAYHDVDWGVPQHDDRTCSSSSILEGAQAGLSWRTVLAKRDRLPARSFAGFDVASVAGFDDDDVEPAARPTPASSATGPRSPATIGNARAVLALPTARSALLWGFVDGAPVQNRWSSMDELPATTPASDRMSKELKRRGFRFVGSTICYSLMQACGLVNDHVVSCFRHDELAIASPPCPEASSSRSSCCCSPCSWPSGGLVRGRHPRDALNQDAARSGTRTASSST